MCGLVGLVDFNNSITKNQIFKMNSELLHRGPDSNGIWVEKNVGFGHTRLAVIDTNSRSDQPMMLKDKRYVIVFNGEIYNFKEIILKLKENGEELVTRSDTEVILKSYKIWGEKCVELFNGMFAFAIWDRKKELLFLARDRLGEKPLFYKNNGDTLIFSSEIHVLVDKLKNSKINNMKIYEFLENNYISDSKTLFDDIKQLPPGNIMIKKKGEKIKLKKYWNLIGFFENKIDISQKLAKERLLELFDNSVKLRMISDVPLGVFLSGGIDSAAVAFSMLKRSKNIKIMTVGFDDSSYDESRDAVKTAEFLGCELQKIYIETDQNKIINAINCASKNLLADNSAIPFWLMSREAKKYVKVSLTGDGADEIFAGYETYIADKLSYKYLKYIPPSCWKIINNLIKKLLPVSFKKISTDFKIRQFTNGMLSKWPESHFSWRKIFNEEDMKNLLCKDNFDEYKSKFKLLDKKYFKSNLDELDNAIISDIQTWLLECLLVKSDRMSMAHGLEIRSPFLDHNLVEFSASLPSSMKLKGFDKKYILKLSQQKRLHKSILTRKKKGFNAPINLWLNSFLKEFAGDMIFSKRLNNIFQSNFINKLWNDHQKMKADNSFKIYNLLILSIWLENNNKYLH